MAEGLGGKNFNWDKEDEYWIPNDGRNLYNSYFYDAHDNTSVLDKLYLHGRSTYQFTDGDVYIACYIFSLNQAGINFIFMLTGEPKA